MSIERRTRDAEASSDVAYGYALDAFGADDGECLVEERPAQVAVVVGAGRLARRSRRWGHGNSTYREGVDNVNMAPYSMLTLAT
jgi:hypothetical protein